MAKKQRQKAPQKTANQTHNQHSAKKGQQSKPTSTKTANVNLKTMQQELQQALDLINQKNTANTGGALVDPEGLNNTQSLLERCAAVVEQTEKNTKPTLRIIHHFACSGGTLISKCLAAQPNVFLLSELHPTTRLGMNMDKAAYTPRDITTQAIYGRVPNVDELAEKLFVDNIIETEKHIRERGGYLVIRAHTHSDFCLGKKIKGLTLNRLLEPHFKITNLVSVRNPVDAFISMTERKWLHFEPGSFDEYCRRLIEFLSNFKQGQIIKYENLVVKPEEVLWRCAEILNLPKSDLATEIFEVFSVSGDSGRTGNIISERVRKGLNHEYVKEIRESEFFQKIQTKYGYGFEL